MAGRLLRSYVLSVTSNLVLHGSSDLLYLLRHCHLLITPTHRSWLCKSILYASFVPGYRIREAARVEGTCAEADSGNLAYVSCTLSSISLVVQGAKFGSELDQTPLFRRILRGLLPNRARITFSKQA